MIEKLKMIKEKINMVTLIGLSVVIAIVFSLLIAISVTNRQEDGVLSLCYENNNQIIEIKEGETITLICNQETSVSVNNYTDLGYPYLDWSYEVITTTNNSDDSTISSDGASMNSIPSSHGTMTSFVLTEKGGRCYFSDSNTEKVKICVSGEGVKESQFYIEFVPEQEELIIKNTSWTAGDINYYLKEDGSVYIIYEYEKNYIKGNYNYVKISEEDIEPEVLEKFKELIPEGLLYQVDIAVSEEYLVDKIYNNDSYVFYMYGNDEAMAIYDGGWGFTKLAEAIDPADEEKISEIFLTASEKANKKISKKKLGSVANTAWSVNGVNYYFYSDGIFESVSLSNHDFIKGTYTCQEVDEESVDEGIVNKFKELMVPKKYFNVTCNVEKEIYNCENVNVTSLNIIIAQNGIKFAVYDSNWDMVLDAEQIDMEAKEDFDVLFDRNIIDITGNIGGRIYISNDIKYSFMDDGTYLMKDSAKDINISGSYIAVDVYDDLIDDELLKLIKNKEYYYVEINIDKIWHEKTDKEETKIPVCSFVIITCNKDSEEYYLYDSYLGSYDDAEIERIEK